MKDGVRLLVYFAAVIFFGALLAPILFWSAQWLAAHNIFPALARFDFETFFHRALLIVAVILLWPLLRIVRIRKMTDLSLEPNSRWSRDLGFGLLIAAVPLLCCAGTLILFHVFSWRPALTPSIAVKIVAAAIAVPMIEEALFRGLLLGIFLRAERTWLASLLTSALYSIIHFLKAPGRTTTLVSWSSGFNSLAHSFSQFADPILVAAGFTTLFLIGLVLADARLQTKSLWLPIGLHSGWIFANGFFNKIAHRDMIILPWLGRNLLVGIVPLVVVGLTWAIMSGWLKRNVT